MWWSYLLGLLLMIDIDLTYGVQVNPYFVQMEHVKGKVDTVAVHYHKCKNGAGVKSGVCTDAGSNPSFLPRKKEFKYTKKKGESKTISIIGGPKEGTYKLTNVKNNQDLQSSGKYFYMWVKTRELADDAKDYKYGTLGVPRPKVDKVVQKSMQLKSMIGQALLNGPTKTAKHVISMHVFEFRISNEIRQGAAVIIDGDRVHQYRMPQPTQYSQLPLLETQYEDNQYPTEFTTVAMGSIATHVFPKADTRYFFAVYEGDETNVRYVQEPQGVQKDNEKVGHTSLCSKSDHEAVFEFALHAIWGGHIFTGSDKKIKDVDNKSGHFQPYGAYASIMYGQMGLTENTHWTQAGQAAHVYNPSNKYNKYIPASGRNEYDNAYDHNDDYDDALNIPNHDVNIHHYYHHDHKDDDGYSEHDTYNNQEKKENNYNNYVDDEPQKLLLVITVILLAIGFVCIGCLCCAGFGGIGGYYISRLSIATRNKNDYFQAPNNNDVSEA